MTTEQSYRIVKLEEIKSGLAVNPRSCYPVINYSGLEKVEIAKEKRKLSASTRSEDFLG